MNIFSSVGSYVSDFISPIASFMEANPNTARFIGGAAIGGLNYYQREQERKEAQRRLEDSYVQAPNGNANYNSHTQSLTDGLLAKK